MKVEFFPRAESDILRQFRYYLVDLNTPQTALRFRQAVIESVDQLARHPRIGSVFRGSIAGLRSWPVQAFKTIRIYYVEESRALRAVRILHSRRDVRRILRQERS